jgi:hypothetical protein
LIQAQALLGRKWGILWGTPTGSHQSSLSSEHNNSSAAIIGSLKQGAEQQKFAVQPL